MLQLALIIVGRLNITRMNDTELLLLLLLFLKTINLIPQTKKQTSPSVRTPRLERGESWEVM